MSSRILKEKGLPQTEKPPNKLLNGEFLTKTKAGYPVVNITKDDDDRNIAIVYRPKTDDYVVAIKYDVDDGTWGQGLYVSTLEKAEQALKEQYGDKPKIYENEEWKKEMAQENNKRQWLKVNVGSDAYIRRYENHTFMRMPTDGEYAGYTYNIFNDRIKDSTIIVDIGSDTREKGYEIRLPENDTVLLKNRAGDEVELTAEEFIREVGEKGGQHYSNRSESGKQWFSVTVPQSAISRQTESWVSVNAPNGTPYEGMFAFLPKGLVKEDTANEDKEQSRLIISLPEDFTVNFVDRKNDGEELEVNASEFYDIYNGKTEKDFTRKVKSQQKNNDDSGRFLTVEISDEARIVQYDKHSFMKMPKNSDYEGFTYNLANSLIKSQEDGVIQIGVPEYFTIKVKNLQEDKEDELTAEKFIEILKNSKAEDYAFIPENDGKPREDKFAEIENYLIANIPDEMKRRNNWVAVNVWTDKESGKIRKRPINCNTGEYAESDNPETWTDFESACKFAHESGATTLAYALDGADNICCVDIDHCKGEDGRHTELVREVFTATPNTYTEQSISGEGIHVFGKTSELTNLRAFSKDGDMEFYRKSKFITVTGNAMTTSKELKNFDLLPVKTLLQDKFVKRETWQNTGKNLEGLSTLSDREVVEKAFAAKNGETFKRLYNGEDLKNNHSNSDMQLLSYLAYWCNGDKEQMLRIFATSGLYRPDKSPDYYESSAIKAIEFIPQRFQQSQNTNTPVKTKGNFSGAGRR